MAQRIIGTEWTRQTRNDINDNFTELYAEYIGAGMDAAEAKEKAIQAVADSTIAKQDAAEAREMVQQIIDGSFDTGALDTNIRQRLNDLETEYAPKLNSVSEQLAQIAADVVNIIEPINLIPPFTEWDNLHPNVTIIESYKVTLNNEDGTIRSSDIFIEVKPNTTYTFSIKTNSEDTRTYLQASVDGATSSRTASTIQGSGNGTITTTSDEKFIRISFDSGTAIGVFTFEDLMLSEGDDVIPFKPRTREHLVYKADKAELEATKVEISDIESNLSVNIGGNMNSMGASATKSPSPTITIIDDDTRNELYTKLFPIAKSKNIPITAALISSRIGNSPNTITYEQFLEMKDSGLVEYVNHTHDHVALNGLTESEIDYQIRKCEEWLRKEGIFTRHIAYPFGKYSHTVRKIASRYVDSASIYGSQVYRPNRMVLDSMYINRTTLETDMATIKARIDTAKNDNGWIIINTHAHYPEFTEERMNEVIDYAIAQGLVFKKFSDAYKDFSNIVELRRNDVLVTGISATGFTEGVKDYEIFHPSSKTGTDINNFNVNTPASSYPANKTTVVAINSSNASRWGLPSAGTLIVDKKHNDDYTFQTFHPIYGTNLLKRSWDSRISNWTPFGEHVEVKRHTQAVGAYTIPGGASQNLTVNSPSFEIGKSCIVTPNMSLTNGLTYSFAITESGVGILRIYNVTTSSITLPKGDWVFTTI